MVRDRDIVLFLGAGFSKPAGLPLMREFGTESRKDYAYLKKHADADPKATAHRLGAREFVRAAETFYSFQELCTSVLTSRADTENLETVFGIAEMLHHAQVKGLVLRKQVVPVADVLTYIKLWLWKIYQQLPILNHRYAIDQSPYERFFEILKPIADRVVVVTTNYDILFEYLACRHGMPVSYPMRSGPDLALGNTERFVVDAGSPGSIELCKLHGSINYFRTEPRDPNSLAISRTLGGKIGRSRLPPTTPAILAVDAFQELKRNHPEMMPELIPPTYAKLSRAVWVRDTWQAAFRAFQSSSRIVFIGYGMPETDGFFGAFLRAAFVKRGGLPEVRVINRSKDALRRYRTLFGRLQDEGNPASFEDLTENELREVLGLAA